jgi:hypothetical protein
MVVKKYNVKGFCCGSSTLMPAGSVAIKDFSMALIL